MDQRGYLFVEVLVAMVILSMGMAAMLTMNIVGQRGVAETGLMTQASTLAQSKMEESLSIPFEILEEGNLSGEEKIEGFIRKWEYLPNRPMDDYITVRVEVHWPSREGKIRRTRLFGIKTRGVVP